MLSINGIPFGNNEFGNGEAIYTKVPLNEDCNTIEMVFEDNRDIGNLCMAATYLAMEKPSAAKMLTMQYVPYSRMDREIGEQLFSLKYFAQLINWLDFTKVYVMDAHSEETTKRLDDVTELSIDGLVNKAIGMFRPDFIFFPDKGAKARYTTVISKDILDSIPHFFGNKVRDLENKGKILRYGIDMNGVEPEKLKNSRVLIIDDLCSRGGTFMAAATKLKELGVAHIGLYVTHCEQSIFQGDIFKTGLIEQVFTTNSMKQRIVTL